MLFLLFVLTFLSNTLFAGPGFSCLSKETQVQQIQTVKAKQKKEEKKDDKSNNAVIGFLIDNEQNSKSKSQSDLQNADNKQTLENSESFERPQILVPGSNILNQEEIEKLDKNPQIQILEEQNKSAKSSREPSLSKAIEVRPKQRFKHFNFDITKLNTLMTQKLIYRLNQIPTLHDKYSKKLFDKIIQLIADAKKPGFELNFLYVLKTEDQKQTVNLLGFLIAIFKKNNFSQKKINLLTQLAITFLLNGVATDYDNIIQVNNKLIKYNPHRHALNDKSTQWLHAVFYVFIQNRITDVFNLEENNDLKKLLKENAIDQIVKLIIDYYDAKFFEKFNIRGPF